MLSYRTMRKRPLPLSEFATNECPYCEGTGLALNHQGVGQHVRSLRKQADKSLRRVAREMQISAAYLSDLERGNRNWSQGLYEDVMDALK